uniref:GNAT family N-acetyltransferase n=1 Tax=Tessaracoccus timonensis TaxID=2161816 RepID=UPI000D5535B1|nr:GNAT family N-acetyltransferase [Tessaracoccus timonensis]
MRIKTWDELTKDEFYEIATLRCAVFYVEQRVTDQDFDDVDRAQGTHHLWIPDERGVAAYLRCYQLPQPEAGATIALGRMAVRADRRGAGLAKRLVAAVVERWGDQAIVLHSQSYIMGLYEGFGFQPVGEPYDEAGIPHQTMVRASY